MNEDAIDRKLVCAFIAGLISDDGERKKGLEYIRNMPAVNPQPCEDAISRENAIIRISWDFPTLEISKVKESLDKLPSVNHQEAEYDPSADLISREETLTAFADYVGSGMSMNDFDALWDIVAKMPSVNPTKTGHWIKRPQGFKCSKCLIIHSHTSIFCPSCGAKMFEPQERSDKE